MSTASGPRINESPVLLGLLEDGDLARDLSAKIKEAIQKTREVSGPKQSGTCSVTMKLTFKVDGDAVEIKPEITESIPKAPRGSTMFFLTRAGEISMQSPKQHDMFLEDADVRAARRES